MDGAGPDLEHPAFRALDVQRVAEGNERGLVLVDRLGLSEPTFLGEDLLAVVGQFDGRRDIAAICARAAPLVGQQVDPDEVRELVRQLDARLLLHSPAFRTAMERAAAAFLGGGVRPSRHHGSAGYPAAVPELTAALDAMLGPPGTPRPAPRGLVAPHIDLARGADGYAAAYGGLLAGELPDLWVLFGTGHAGPQAPLTGLPLDWQTPLGVAPTDRAFVAAVHDAIGPATAADQFLHRDEHSLEFQVLFLQHIAQRRGLPPPRVAAFLCGHLPSAAGDPGGEAYAQGLLAALRGAAAASGRRVGFLAGADLAHVGPFFGDRARVDAGLQAQVQQRERQRLRELEAGRPGAFHAAVQAGGNPDRVCSATSLWLVGNLAGGAAALQHYGLAAATDGSQAVGFCAARYD